MSSASFREEQHGFELPQGSAMESTEPCPSTLGRAHRMEALYPPVQAQRKAATMEFCNPAPLRSTQGSPSICIGSVTAHVH